MSNIKKTVLDSIKYLVPQETSWLAKFEFFAILGVLIFALIPIKYTLKTPTSDLLGYNSDFTALAVYFNFIFMGLFLVIGLFKGIFLEKDKRLIQLVLFLIIIALGYQLVLSGTTAIISLYFLIKFGCVLLFGYLVYKSEIFLKYKDFYLWTLVGLGTLNASIALLQFSAQSSLGLTIFGESILAVDLFNVAKTVAHETTFIRAYGLMPHPNILAGLLLIISILNLYLINKSTHYPRLIVSITSFYLISAGIFSTLSRGGIVTYFIVLTIWFYTIFKSRLPIKRLVIPAIFGGILCISLIFWPWLDNRATWNDSAIIERGVFNSTAIQLIESNWLTGTGPGTNLLFMHKMLISDLDYWLIQPIHNYFLIMISEIGLLGMILILFIVYHFARLWQITLTKKTNQSHWPIYLSLIALSIFILFWLDHYFYTIWPTQILLWLILALIIKEVYMNKSTDFS
ncbi:MAG TPA: O-antigen ligase family protein [Candidatus Doudnabacteria bacterium]|nr:O-antigen ligase family protein [Candidatus Doudnabacteria bacterium]